MTETLRLQHDYSDKLAELFYRRQNPSGAKSSELAAFNDALARSLGMDPKALREVPGIFTGLVIPEGAVPIAQAYSGHQFGYFTRLGDGRAVLLGEWEDADGTLWDIQLKGAGKTPYSRGGDGKAGLGPMLREYLVSEAMAGLGIPTTRSLAVALTGETVYREKALAGAMLTRISKAHIRTGTFQYAKEVGDDAAVKELADYTIQRLYPELLAEKAPYLALLKTVAAKLAHLTAQWMGVGFIHGVMNTDNMSIAGETIDYGPCAFMDAYNPAAVFSSIDRNGRYAYGNQPKIAQWNLARFAETLIGITESAGNATFADMEAVVFGFKDLYDAEFRNGMASKIGIAVPEERDDALIAEMLDWMKESQADFTNTFVSLTRGTLRKEGIAKLEPWFAKWESRIDEQDGGMEEAMRIMKRSNPVVIPRNHLVEKALDLAVEQNDLSLFTQMTLLYKNPYDYEAEIADAMKAPMPEEDRRVYRTFCGT